MRESYRRESRERERAMHESGRAVSMRERPKHERELRMRESYA